MIAKSKLVAPNKGLSRKTAPSCELPFGFSGQPFPRPRGISFSVFVSYVHHWVVLSTVEIAPWPCRMLPVRAGYVRPPLEVIVKGDGMIRGRKDHRSRNQIFGRRAGKVLSLGLAFCHGNVFRSAHESRKFLIRHIGLVHPKCINVNAVDGPGIAGCLHSHYVHSRWVLSAHREFTTRNPDHAFRRLGDGGAGVGTGRKESSDGVGGMGSGAAISDP